MDADDVDAFEPFDGDVDVDNDDDNDAGNDDNEDDVEAKDDGDSADEDYDEEELQPLKVETFKLQPIKEEYSGEQTRGRVTQSQIKAMLPDEPFTMKGLSELTGASLLTVRKEV